MREPFFIKQNDTYPIFSAMLIQADGSPIVLSNASSVKFCMINSKTKEQKINSSMIIDDALSGKVSYKWVPNDTHVPGDYLAEVKITFNDNTLLTVPTSGSIQIGVIKDFS